MYTLLHETDESTAVNLSAYGKFLPGAGKQLVTVGAKHLRIFRANPYAIVLEDDQEWSQTTKLECLLSFNLLAPVRDLVAARIPLYPDCDSILMTFDDAKLSICNIHPETMSLNTISMHSMEDDFLRDGHTKDIYSPMLRVDPGNRCAVMTIYGRHLGIVPFHSFGNYLQSYTVALRTIDERLDNVLDMTFLDGYFEPTLLFLYEPMQTTAGRAAIRYDTVCILGVSLNVKDRVHAVVWNFVGLPSSVYQCLSVPLPVGGVTLIGANEIIYLNQSVPLCGILLNTCPAEYTRFPFADYTNMKLTLDRSVAETITSNEILIISRNGDLYVLNLDTDAGNAVRSMDLKKVFEVSIPCSITACSPGYLFVGSRLGDSYLLQYTREFKSITNGTATEIEISVNQTNNGNADLDFYNELYNEPSESHEEEHENQVIKEFKFRVLDKLLNVGPCKIIRTCAANDMNPNYNKDKDNIFDLVTVSGHGKNSSLSFFQRTVRPGIITSSLLDDAVQFWTVGRREDDSHKYLIIAREMSTLVLELETDMVELDAPLFITSETTVAAGELATGSIAVQVTLSSIVLVADDQKLETISIDSNYPIASVSIVDPFVVLLTQNGLFFLYRLMNSPKIHLKLVPILEKLKHEKFSVTSICVYKDISGIIQLCASGDDEVTQVRPLGLRQTRSSMASENLLPVKKEEFEQHDHETDDIDLLLYGDEEKTPKQKLGKNIGKKKVIRVDQEYEDWAPKLETDVQNPNHVLPTYWMLLTRENGNLYIYAIPEMQLVYMVKKFNMLPEVLRDDLASAYEDVNRMDQLISIAPSVQDSQIIAMDNVIVKPEEVVMELQLYGMGMNQARPVLSALVDDTIIFYEMFFFDAGIDGHLAIRFRRLPYSVITRATRFIGQNGRQPVEAARERERHRPYVLPFERIGTLTNGLFICGNYPGFVLMERGEIRHHPMTIDGPIFSFCPFNNLSCPMGFLYLTKEKMMRISLLPSGVIYDTPYPFRRATLDKSYGQISNIVYMLQNEVFGVVTNVKIPVTKVCTIVNEEKSVETFEKDENFVLPEIDKYTLKLFSTEDWNCVPNTGIELDEFEIVTCCEEVLLASESTVSGMQSYLAIGTSLNFGEEVFVRGRIILCEVIEVVPEPGQPTSKHRLKTVCDKEQKGPVTSMCALDGFLLTGMGQKIFIWQFKDGQLNGVSFLDLHFYVHHLCSFRSLALACDLYRSLSLIRYQEKHKALSLVSRDLRPTAPPPMTSSFIVDNKQIGFLMMDEANNVAVFNYEPEKKESVGGERLTLRGVINIGSLVNTVVRIQGHINEPFIENPLAARHCHTCLFATLDGSFGFVRPIAEKVFRRLHMLQQLLNNYFQQPAGLNPKGARSARPQRTMNSQIAAAKNIVDGNIVFQYLNLSTQDKGELAKKLGSNKYQLIDDLTEIRRIVTHF